MDYKNEIENGKSGLLPEQRAFIEGMNAAVEEMLDRYSSEAYAMIFLRMVMFREQNRIRQERCPVME